MNEEEEGHLEPDEGAEEGQQDEQADGPEEGAQSGDDDFSESEQNALKQGWIPPDQYDGPGEPLSAEDFIERGQNHNGILKERNEALAGKLTDMETRLDGIRTDFEDRLGAMSAFNKKAFERQRKALERKYSAEKREAVHSGDAEKYDELTEREAEDLEALSEDIPEEPEKKDDKETVPPVWKQAREKFLTRNVWFNTNEEMTQVAAARHRGLLSEKPGLTPDENFAEVEKFMRATYPGKFGQPKRAGNGASPAEGGGRQGGSSAKKGWRDIPAEERREMKELIGADGIYESEAEAAKDYFTHYEEA